MKKEGSVNRKFTTRGRERKGGQSSFKRFFILNLYLLLGKKGKENGVTKKA